MRIEIYTSDRREIWNNFVHNSKNGTFLFHRDFMEYHSDRFHDYSLLFYADDKLMAMMPANVVDKTFYTHQGLTYGGLVMNSEVTAQQVLEIFDILIEHLRENGYEEIIYRSIPHIYHHLPSEEDLYALFRNKAELIQRNLSSTITLPNSLEYSKTRRRGLLKSDNEKLTIGESENLECFWEILSENLRERYGTKPVHSLEEISLLKEKFPKEIQLYSVLNHNGEMLGGCLTFEMDSITHAQYTAATVHGRECGAIDAVVNYIIEKSTSEDKRYFDYGTSTENGGLYLNEKLIYQKEGFGCRGIVYDVYRIEL